MCLLLSAFASMWWKKTYHIDTIDKISIHTAKAYIYVVDKIAEKRNHAIVFYFPA